MYHYFLSAQLYIISFLFSFYLSSILIKNKYTNQDTSEDDRLEQEMIEHCKNYMFQYKYMDELEELDICFNSVVNKDNITTLEIPFLNNKIVMFYDTERKAFCYYTKSDVIYKYLNVACRKYVIEHNCRALYKDQSYDNTLNDNTLNDNNTNDNTNDNNQLSLPILKNVKKLFATSLFVKKTEKPLLVKNVNKFILVGSLEDYEKTLLSNNLNVKNISFSEYLSLQSNK